MKALDDIISRIELIRDWIDKGIFWDSIDDPEESAHLGPLPNLTELDWDDLEDLIIWPDLLRCDLNENAPPEDAIAHRVREALMERIEDYTGAIGDRLWELEEGE